MKKEFGKCLIDVGKYIITAVIITTIFSEIEEWSALMYIISGGIASALITIGLFLLREENNKRKRKRGGK